MADIGNGCLQDNCKCMDIKKHAFRRTKFATIYLKSSPTSQSILVMQVCRRNMVRGLYLWDVGHQRFPPFSTECTECVHTASMYCTSQDF